MRKILQSRLLAFCAALFAGLCCGGLALLYGAWASPHTATLLGSILARPALLGLNVLPAAALSLLLWLLTDRPWIAALGTGALTVGLGSVHYLKLLFRDDPLIARDIYIFAEAAAAGENYSGYLRPQVLFGILAVLGLTALCALCRGRLGRWKKRIPAAVSAAALLAGAGALIYGSDTLYLNMANIEANSAFLTQWSDTDQYVSRGFIYPLLHSVKTMADPAPAGYDAAAAAAALAERGDGAIPAEKRVHIVGVMLEAFADFEDMGVALSADPCPNLRRLAAAGVSGRLVTNIFAGGTVDTERAFLTGVNELTEFRSDAGSYVRWLKTQGYVAEGGHPCYAWFYNRRNVNRYLGFDDYWYYEDRYADPKGDTYGGIMTDRPFYEDLLSQLDGRIAQGQHCFQFSVTYQNHAPYDAETRYFSTEYVAKAGALTEEGYNIVNNYLSGIAQSDAAIGYLADELQKRAAPIVLVFFGDHKPWLGDGNAVYAQLGVDLSRADERSFLNYYATPYVIWANDAAKALLGRDFSGSGGNISPCFLMNRLFQLCGYTGPAFMQAGDELMERVPVFTGAGAYWENGAFTGTLSPEGAAALADFQKLEYYWRKNP